jgi:hypothetical protein
MSELQIFLIIFVFGIVVVLALIPFVELIVLGA